MNINKLAMYGSFLTLFIAFIFLVTVFYWLLWPYHPADFNGVFVPVKNIKAGELLTYQIDYCKYQNLPSEITRSFVDGIIFTTTTVITNNPLGCRSTYPTIIVPKELPSGVYAIRSVWTYHVNPIRDVTYTLTSNSFMVTNESTPSNDKRN